MTMTRTDAVRYLSANYSTLETLTDTSPSDSNIGYRQVINDALLTLPVSTESSAYDEDFIVDVTANKMIAYRTLLRFFALTMYKAKLSTDESYAIDSGGGFNTKRSVAFAQVDTLLNDVIEQLAAMDPPYIIGSTPAMPRKAVRIRDLFGDLLEPNVASNEI